MWFWCWLATNKRTVQTKLFLHKRPIESGEKRRSKSSRQTEKRRRASGKTKELPPYETVYSTTILRNHCISSIIFDILALSQTQTPICIDYIECSKPILSSTYRICVSCGRWWKDWNVLNGFNLPLSFFVSLSAPFPPVVLFPASLALKAESSAFVPFSFQTIYGYFIVLLLSIAIKWCCCIQIVPLVRLPFMKETL